MLRWYQQQACDSAWDSLISQRGNPLIDLPTGSGKSWVLADIARKAVTEYSGRVVIVAHRKELLEQNADKISQLCSIPVGFYSASLGARDCDQDIILAGIQSVYAKASELGRRHMVIIDECHLTPKSDDGMYRQFIGDLSKYNPKLKLVGLTATPYRLDSGRLWGKDELFNHCCYRGDIRKLIEEGYLCNLINKTSSTQYDTSGLHTRLGEFVRREVEDLFGNKQLIIQACKELIQKSIGRNSILVFCSGVQHAQEVAEMLTDMTGERADCITGETPPLIRESSLRDYAAGDLRWLVNVDVLTTGFDSPRTDCVAIMRATQSAGLFCQIVGRGLRTHEGKQDCLIIDFGNNLRRHGPIDAVNFGEIKTKSDGNGETPKKTCPGCGEVVTAGAKECSCGFIFTFVRKDHETTSDDESQILSEPETFVVTEWLFSRHFKKGDPSAPNTLRVTYFTEGDLGTAIEEWVCLNHEGFAFRKASQWWREHTDSVLDEVMDMEQCDGVGAAIDVEQRGYMRMPVAITAVRQGRFWRIVSRVAGELRPKAVEEEIPF